VKVHQLGGGMTNEPSVRTTGNEAANGAKRG
jgi:hypothetical protein